MTRKAELIDISRAAEPLPPEVQNTLTEKVTAQNEQASIYLYQPPCKIIILGAGELGRFLESMQIFDIDLDGLEKHLDEGLPPSSERALDIPAYPFGIHTNGNRGHHTFTLGANNETIKHERIMAKKLVEEFFGIDKEDAAEAWGVKDYLNQYWLAKSRNEAGTLALKSILESEPDILPATLSLEPILFDDRDFMPSRKIKSLV